MAASLVKKVLTNPVRLNNAIQRLQLVRLAGTWNKDWKPGPYPQTEAERIAAAKKYGLLPQDYQPYPDDGEGRGDYPNLPLVPNIKKDPFVNWDEPDIKRNYGEPMHALYEQYVEEKLSNESGPYTLTQWATYLFGVIFVYVSLYHIFEYNDWRVKHPWIGKQYPNSGKTHYTFEPVD